MKIRLMVAFVEGDDVLAVLSAKQTKELIGYSKRPPHEHTKVGNTVVAIKALRTWTTLNLREAKNIIDVLHDENTRRAAYQGDNDDVKGVVAPLTGA